MVTELNIVEEFIKDLVETSEKDKYEVLIDKIKNFVKIVLKDKERLKEISYLDTTNMMIYDNIKENREKLLRILLAIKNEIKLKEDFKENEGIDKIAKKLEKTKKEAERRGAVVEGKYAGGLIEFLDMQRQELKKRIDLEKKLDDINTKLNQILEKLNKEKDATEQ